MLLIIASVTLVAVIFRPVTGCSCLPPNPQDSFCTATFALKATVISDDTEYGDSNYTPLERQYTIRFMRKDIYKGSNFFPGANTTASIKTAGYQSTCGIRFEIGQEYFITGSLDNLVVSLCDWISPLNNLTNHQRRGIQYMYEQGCNKCSIMRCFGRSCNNANVNQTCMVDNPTNINNCHNKYGFCLENDQGICKWKDNRLLKLCLNPKEVSRQVVGTQ